MGADRSQFGLRAALAVLTVASVIGALAAAGLLSLVPGLLCVGVLGLLLATVILDLLERFTDRRDGGPPTTGD